MWKSLNCDHLYAWFFSRPRHDLSGTSIHTQIRAKTRKIRDSLRWLRIKKKIHFLSLEKYWFCFDISQTNQIEFMVRLRFFVAPLRSGKRILLNIRQILLIMHKRFRKTQTHRLALFIKWCVVKWVRKLLWRTTKKHCHLQNIPFS